MMMRPLAMWMLLLAAAGCAPLPPTPQDLQAKTFEMAPGKAVLYLVRTRPDLSYLPATIMLDDQMIGTTHEGTYFRWELAPGRHRIRGYASDNGEITVDVQADRLYFVRQTVMGGPRVRNGWSTFRIIGETQGRAAVIRGSLIG